MFFFFARNSSSKLENKRDFLFVCGKTIFFCRDKDCTLTYRMLTSFMASFAYLEFLDIIKVISLSKFFFPNIFGF
jgi:hypothetical protein